MLCIAEGLIASGAEVSRVEDTLRRIGMAYGADRVDAVVITTSIVMTIIMPDGSERTQSRRLHGSGGIDFSKLEALNELSREVCASPIPGEDLRRRAVEISSEPRSRVRLYIGNILVGSAFTVFFGGGPLDACAAGIFGLFARAVMDAIGPIAPNIVIFDLLCSFITGTAIRGAWALIECFSPGALNVDAILIGDIMLMIPGLALTNSVRDLLAGETISGMMRLVETLLWAGAIAGGIMLSMLLI